MGWRRDGGRILSSSFKWRPSQTMAEQVTFPGEVSLRKGVGLPLLQNPSSNRSWFDRDSQLKDFQSFGSRPQKSLKDVAGSEVLNSLNKFDLIQPSMSNLFSLPPSTCTPPPFPFLGAAVSRSTVRRAERSMQTVLTRMIVSGERGRCRSTRVRQMPLLGLALVGSHWRLASYVNVMREW